MAEPVHFQLPGGRTPCGRAGIMSRDASKVTCSICTLKAMTEVAQGEIESTKRPCPRCGEAEYPHSPHSTVQCIGYLREHIVQIEIAGLNLEAKAIEYTIKAAPLVKKLPALTEKNKKLYAMLKKATTRIEILLGRMRACQSTEHELSFFEGEGWLNEQKELLNDAQDETP
jgi:hypothetical protein